MTTRGTRGRAGAAIGLAATVGLVAGCGSAGKPTTAADLSSKTVETVAPTTGAESGALFDSTTVPAAATDAAGTAAGAPATASSASGSAGGGGGSAGGATSAAPVSPATTFAPRNGGGLRAGSVDDNARFDDYLAFLGKGTAPSAHKLDVTGRQVLTVTDAGGVPVLGATVEVTGRGGAVAGKVVTHSDGRAIFLPKATSVAGPFSARVSKGQSTATTSLDGQGSPTLKLDGPGSGQVSKLDVLFLLDTTGSMGDELDRLKTTIGSVSERLSKASGNADIRFGLTAYKDRGDVYVTKTTDLTGDVGAFSKALSALSAGGGGDTPEDLSAGLHEALNKPTWRGDDTAKVVFLVADAGPHLDYQGPDYLADAQAAAARGIRIHPIASSGLDDLGEYVYRQLAQITTGRFVFLTYGADGASPGDGTDHHVDKYAVLSLDDLVVQLATEELRPGRSQ